MRQVRSPKIAKSAGFSGSYEDDYYPLYALSCERDEDCISACIEAGGTDESCAVSECIESEAPNCLPPTYWFDVDRALTQEDTQESSAWVILVNNPYQDQLLASDFDFEVPPAAKVVGIEVSLHAAADWDNSIADGSVQLLRDGAYDGEDRAQPTPWPTSFQSREYGGRQDGWGSSWTAEDLNSRSFGVAFTPKYIEEGGNARLYLDALSVAVHYTLSCDATDE